MYQNVIAEIYLLTEPLVPLVQILGLIFLIIYVVKTWQMASATREAAKATEKSVDEMKEMRDQETAPYIITYFYVPITSPNVIYLVVKNIGHSVAERVRLTFNPMLESRFNISEMNFIKNGTESMPPEYEIRTLFDERSSFYNSDRPRKYEVKISYFGGLQTNERVYKQTLDLSHYEDLFDISQKDIGHIVNELQKIHKNLQDLKKPLDNIANTMENGIFINNPTLYITSNELGNSVQSTHTADDANRSSSLSSEP